MASAGEMSLNDTANVIPWFATGRTGAHIGNFPPLNVTSYKMPMEQMELLGNFSPLQM